MLRLWLNGFRATLYLLKRCCQNIYKIEEKKEFSEVDTVMLPQNPKSIILEKWKF